MRGTAAIATALVVVAGAGVGIAAVLDGGSPGDRSGARDDCSPPYHVIRKAHHSLETRERARRGLFSVHRTLVRLHPPIDWRQNPERSRAFAANLQRMAWIDPLLAAYRSQPDLKALRLARAIALDWVRRNPRRAFEPYSAAAWGEKIAGDRAPYLAFIRQASACEGVLSPPQRRTLDRSLREHGRFLAADRNYEPTNHGLFVDLGLIYLAGQLGPSERTDTWRRIATRRFRATLLNRIYPAEGYWLEHSSSYHLVALAKLEQFLRASDVHDPRLVRLAERMRAIASWLVEPDGQIVQFGDSDLEPAEPRLERPARELEGSLVLRRSGLAVVRAPGSYLAVAAGFHNGSHKHSDELSFELFERGQRLISDTGLFHKDEDAIYEFAHSNRAHSTLVVDGQPWPTGENAAYGSGIEGFAQARGWYAIAATNPLVRPQGVRHQRLFLYRPGFALIVVDRLRSSAAHEYTRYLQLGPRVDLRAGARALSLALPGRDAWLTYSRRGPGAAVEATRGEHQPLGGFTYPSFERAVPRWTLALSSVGGDRTEAVAFGFDGRVNACAAHASGVTTVGLAGSGPSAAFEVERRGRGLELRVRPGTGRGCASAGAK